jgi:hypothetical protein
MTVLDVKIDAQPHGYVSWENGQGPKQKNLSGLNEGDILELLESLGPKTRATIVAHPAHERYLGLFQMACASSGISFSVLSAQ